MKKLSKIITQSYDSGISRIKICDPSNYNGLSFNNLKSLIKNFKNFNKDKITKVIIIEGSGKGFCAGHDLNEIRGLKKKIKV